MWMVNYEGEWCDLVFKNLGPRLGQYDVVIQPTRNSKLVPVTLGRILNAAAESEGWWLLGDGRGRKTIRGFGSRRLAAAHLLRVKEIWLD